MIFKITWSLKALAGLRAAASGKTRNDDLYEHLAQTQVLVVR